MSPVTTARAVLRTARPRQWMKNLLVLAAPLAAGVLTDPDVLAPVLAAAALMVLASASIYLFNDVVDAEADRNHPTKRTRPVASGELPAGLAIGAGVVSALLALAGALAMSTELAVTIAVYLAMQVSYVLGLKHQPVLDLAVVSSGFLLRAVAGGVAASVPLSQWFLIVAAFGSLYMVAGKRFSELHTVGADALTRRSLTMYSESYLRFVWGTAAGITITAYSLWAFEMAPASGVPWQAISIFPFVIAMLRYGSDIDRGAAGEPEDVVLRDPVLLGVAAVWLLTFSLGLA